MKNNMINSIRLSFLIAASALAFASCNDWTEYESLDVKTPSLEDQNPGLYAEYVKSLKAYKTGVHKAVFVTFNNIEKTPSKQAEHLTVIPDSVDFISLDNPTKLNEVIISEMTKVREKGTKVIYDIDYRVFESEWVQMAKKDPSLTEEDALAHFTARTAEMLALCDQFGYDGVTITYPGRSLVSLPEEDLVVYNARQKSFLDPALAWREAHKSKSFSFIGNAHFLLDENKAILPLCDYIIMMTDMANNASDMTIGAMTAVGSGNVPSDRFIAAVQTTRPDDKEMLYGYFGSVDTNGNKVRSIGGAALWVGLPSDFTRAGLMIRNAQYDYYNQTLVYRYIREAIAIMNPSPKN